MTARRIVWSLVLLASLAGPGRSGDFEILEDRLTVAFQASKPKAATVNGYVSTLSAAGRWSDINYADTKLDTRFGTFMKAWKEKFEPPLALMVHRIHLVGGEQNHSLTTFQGECTHGHKLDLATGTRSIPSAAEK